MNLFGGLFGHDAKSARAAGKFTDDATAALPSAPPTPQAGGAASDPMQAPAMTGNIGSGFSFAPQTAQLDQLPTAPPAPAKKAGAFDDDHYRQTMLAMAAGFFGSQNFGDGLSKAAEAIYNGNADAQKKAQVSYGGPDGAFEITTDPHTGKRTYTPVQEVVDYQNHKAAKLTPEKLLDLNGRYALALQGTDPAKRGEAAAFMANNPTLYPGFNPALVGAGDNLGLSASTGQTVTQSGAAAQRADAEQRREADRAYKRGQGDQRIALQAKKTDASIAQGNERIGLSAAAGGRAAQSNTRANLKAGISPDGYQYRMGPNGKIQRRKVF